MGAAGLMSGHLRLRHVVSAVGVLVLMLTLLLSTPGVSAEPGARLLPAGSGAPADAVYQTVCQPRPAVRTQMTSLGENRFSITVTAGRGALELIRIGNAPMARLDLPGQTPGITPPYEVKPPVGASTYTLQ